MVPDAENGSSIDPVASATNLLNTVSKDDEDLEDDRAEIVKEGKAPEPESELSSPFPQLEAAVSQIQLGHSKRSTDFDFQDPQQMAMTTRNEPQSATQRSQRDLGKMLQR
jgi:hypothetical protein